jgi:hypothetical protein
VCFGYGLGKMNFLDFEIYVNKKCPLSAIFVVSAMSRKYKRLILFQMTLFYFYLHTVTCTLIDRFPYIVIIPKRNFDAMDLFVLFTLLGAAFQNLEKSECCMVLIVNFPL